MCPRFDSGSRHHEIEGSKCGSSSGVEHNLAKVGVAGSNPVFRSIFYPQTIISLKVNKTLRLLFMRIDMHNAEFVCLRVHMVFLQTS